MRTERTLLAGAMAVAAGVGAALLGAQGADPVASILAAHKAADEAHKPATGKEKSTWQAGDFAYLGAGSAEWANQYGSYPAGLFGTFRT